jgi:flagellar basal-body rod modification protein FlgD
MPNVTSVNNVANSNPTNRISSNSMLGKDEFLNLLVTQLRYQDPMEPMKDTDFVAQLAQFSSLEQLSSINTSLDNSSQLNYVLSQTIANTMATTLIGKEVIAAGNGIAHTSGHNDNLNFNLGGEAAKVDVKIYDDKGTLVRTISKDNLGQGMNSVTWDGKNDSGADVSAGNYTYSVSATNQAGETVTAETRRIGIVESVRYEDGQGYLIVNGQKISMSDIIEVVLPGQSGHSSIDNG